MEEESKCWRKPKVLMLPWFGHSHISSFLELAKKLSERNFHIYFCSTPISLTHLRSSEEQLPSSIELVELHLPSLPSLPPHLHTTKNLGTHLINTLKDALDLSLPNIKTIFYTLTPDLFIYDFNFPWDLVGDDQNDSLLHKIPAVAYYSIGAATFSLFFHPMLHHGATFPFPGFSGLQLEERGHESDDPKGDARSRDSGPRSLHSFKRSSNLFLIKSSRETEGKYIEYLSTLTDKKVVPVGSLVYEGRGDDDQNQNQVIEWLGGKDIVSTVYVSCGSECFLSKRDIVEMAHGLELSNVNFIWVLRFPKAGEKVKMEEALPEGFLERTRERGLMVGGWAPQSRILKHSSIGGFVSHCGWGSVTESLRFGVPIIACPLMNDQPLNARFLAELGAGLEMKRDAVKGELERGEVARVIREVMTGETGEEMRRKARELSERITIRGDEEIDAAADELLNLCLP